MQTCVTEEAEHFDVNSINIRLGAAAVYTLGSGQRRGE